MSLLLATQLTAVATGVLAVFAFMTAVLAFFAWRKQSQEVRDQARLLEVQATQLAEQRKVYEQQTPVLELQALELRESLEQRKREAERRRNGQASRVFVIEERHPKAPLRPTVTALALNTSDQPVYDAEFSWYRSGSSTYAYSDRERIGTLLPGTQSKSRRREFGEGDYPHLWDTVLRFRDAAGVRWERRVDGFLEEQPGQDADQTVELPGSTRTLEPSRISGPPATAVEALAAQVRRSLVQRDLDAEEQRRSAEEQRRSQAARVSAWFDLKEPVSDKKPVSKQMWGARIRNTSDLPVTNVRTFFRHVNQAQPDAWAPLIPVTDNIPVIPPGSDRFIAIPLPSQDKVEEGEYTVSIEFTDAAGNRWERDPHGALISRS